MIILMGRKPNHLKSRCFTLVEMMVSIAIALVLMVFLSTMVQMVEKTLRSNREFAATTSQARLIFNRLDYDLKKMPKRKDMGYTMTNVDGETDFLRFVTQIQGPGGDRKVSLVGYRQMINADGVTELYRGIRGYQWEDVGFMGLNSSGLPPDLMRLPESLSLTDKDYDLLARGVLKVDLCFQYKNSGKLFRNPPNIFNGTNQVPGSVAITNISSIVVGLVLMDNKGLALMTPEISEALVSRFTSPPEGVMPFSHWSTNLYQKNGELEKSLSKPILQSIRVYQRFFPLD